jgi:hypothetical protein
MIVNITGERAFNVVTALTSGASTQIYFDKQTNDDTIMCHYGKVINDGDDFNVFDTYKSVKEFAFAVRPTETSTLYWLPDHGTGTVFTDTSVSTPQALYIDGVYHDGWDTTTVSATTVTLVQKLVGIHPDKPEENMCNIELNQSIVNGVYSYTCDCEFLYSTKISTGYVCMFPIRGPTDFASYMLTAWGNEYETSTADGSSTDLTIEGGGCESYAFVATSSGTKSNYGAVMEITNIEDSFRYGESGTRSPLCFLEHRDGDVQKIYPQVYNNYDAATGHTISFGAKYFIGYYEDAYNSLKRVI